VLPLGRFPRWGSEGVTLIIARLCQPDCIELRLSPEQKNWHQIWFPNGIMNIFLERLSPHQGLSEARRGRDVFEYPK
jgi:hypothetical protein